MHGIGNDFVLLDAVTASSIAPGERSDLARAMCDRRRGIGADGLIFVESSNIAHVCMRMLNPDGSESEMCGNGLRCVALFWGREGSITIETGGRVVSAERLDGRQVRVEMGFSRVIDLHLVVEGYTGVSVDVGNPHFVVFVPSVAAIDLEGIGPILERAPAFPNRTNVHFAERIDARTVRMRTWERGAGITLACGSGACAVAAAAVALGHTSTDVHVHLPGGILRIEIGEDGSSWMTGPAEFSFTGRWKGCG